VKILFLSSSLAPRFGGAAFSESALSSALGQHHDVVVLSRKNRVDPSFAVNQGIKKLVSFYPISVLLAFLNPRHPLNREIRSSNVFHLNGHWFWENYFFARLCYRYGVPYVLHPRGMLWVAYRKPKTKKLFNLILGNWIVSHASRVILLSQFEKKHCEAYALKKENIVVIPNGVSSVTNVVEAGLPESYFLYLGRIEPRKNLEFLVRAFAEFYKTNKSCKLRLIGPAEKGYDRFLKNLISELKLDSAVTLEPGVYGVEKDKVLRNSMAVVYPAFEEPFGRTIFEAFAAGTFCLIPGESGGAEYVQTFAPYMIYGNNEVQALKKKMESVVALPQSQRAKYVEICRSWVSSHLDWGGITQRVLQIYSQVLS